MNLIEWINGKTKLNKATMDEFQGNIQTAINENTTNIATNEANISNLQDGKINNYKSITVTDFNILTETGFYYCNRVNTAENAPVATNGYLFVHRLNDVYIYQMFTTVNDGYSYMRVCNNGTWQDWTPFMYKNGGTLTGPLTLQKALTLEGALELTSATPYIDFHFNKSSNDYTSRIRESASGKLDIDAQNGVALTGTLAARTVHPVTSATYDLGSSGALWRYLYINEIVSTTFKMYNSGSHMIIGVGLEATVRHQNDINQFMPISASAFNQQSSKRYKENIIDMTEDEANKLDNINVVTFDYKVKANGVNQAGVIAEDVYEILPNVVTLKEIDGEKVPDSVDYSKFVPYLIKKVQMLEKRVSELESKEVQL